jgi:transketolase
VTESPSTTIFSAPPPEIALTAPATLPENDQLTNSPESAWRTINSLRVLAMDAVEQAQSGHPGTPMALAPVGYQLWDRVLRFDPAHPEWEDRDRFVLSCGHASLLIYGLLHLSGYDLSLDDIRHFRQFGSKTPGHPERGHTVGVETTTGPLGQGFGNSVGMAIAEQFLANYFNRPGFDLVNHRTWVFASDGDMMEGVASEAASLAGHLRLGNLKLIYDDNHITIDGSTSLAFSEDVGRRFEAYGWQVQHVGDGNDLDAIARALDNAAAETGRPSLIILRTHIGDPAPTKKDTAAAHGAPLGAEEVAKTKAILGWPVDQKFVVAPEAALWRAHCLEKGRKAYSEWQALWDRYRRDFPDLAAEFTDWQAGRLPKNWDEGLPVFTPADGKLATRQASAKTLNAIAAKVKNLIGGSADLAESTGSDIKGGGSFSATAVGRILHFGVREHGMVASLNGMAAHGGIRPFGTTFLIFSDYCRPSLRLAALMKLPVIFIGTHDSIGLGEDGPTHQPIEQLAMLRATPNMTVIRPADANETVQAWRSAIEKKDGPTVLALTRQKLAVLDRTKLASAEGARRGGYVLLDCKGTPEAIVIATGSEVHPALAAVEKLQGEGKNVRLVSLPSWELFEAQPEAYRESVLPESVTARVSVEAAATFGWIRWVGDRGVAIGLDHFGASAPAEVVFKEFGFTADRIADTVMRLIAN